MKQPSMALLAVAITVLAVCFTVLVATTRLQGPESRSDLRTQVSDGEQSVENVTAWRWFRRHIPPTMKVQHVTPPAVPQFRGRLSPHSAPSIEYDIDEETLQRMGQIS